jgi:vancomycin resistance protein VanW
MRELKLVSMIKRIKLFIKIHLRYLNDFIKGNYNRFPKHNFDFANLNYELTVIQEIKPSPTFESKVFNLATASSMISDYVILPDQLFSFWNVVGDPDKSFKKGRTIQNGKIKEDVGGGICQVSGGVYYLCLISGLEVVERHNHSVDLYDDESRFAPLGTDATVVYGYKDLRFVNNLNTVIKFDIAVVENKIIGRLRSEKRLNKNELMYSIEKVGEIINVKVFDNNGQMKNSSFYKKLNYDL